MPCICPIDQNLFDVSQDHLQYNALASACGKFKIIQVGREREGRREGMEGGLGGEEGM
jgi:hypothetical protein